jgi:hypothetical protein
VQPLHKVHCRISKSSPEPDQSSPYHLILPYHLYKVHTDIIHAPTSWSYQWCYLLLANFQTTRPHKQLTEKVTFGDRMAANAAVSSMHLPPYRPTSHLQSASQGSGNGFLLRPSRSNWLRCKILSCCPLPPLIQPRGSDMLPLPLFSREAWTCFPFPSSSA